MIKFIIGIFFGCLLYLALTPSWQFTLGSFSFVLVVFFMLLSLIGIPSFLILSKWLKQKSLLHYSLKILICVQLSFLVPLILWRWFQVYLAKAKNLSQVGDMAMFHAGNLSDFGKCVILKDFFSLLASGLLVTLIVCAFEYFDRRKSTERGG